MKKVAVIAFLVVLMLVLVVGIRAVVRAVGGGEDLESKIAYQATAVPTAIPVVACPECPEPVIVTEIVTVTEVITERVECPVVESPVLLQQVVAKDQPITTSPSLVVCPERPQGDEVQYDPTTGRGHGRYDGVTPLTISEGDVALFSSDPGTYFIYGSETGEVLVTQAYSGRSVVVVYGPATVMVQSSACNTHYWIDAIGIVDIEERDGARYQGIWMPGWKKIHYKPERFVGDPNYQPGAPEPAADDVYAAAPVTVPAVTVVTAVTTDILGVEEVTPPVEDVCEQGNGRAGEEIPVADRCVLWGSMDQGTVTVNGKDHVLSSSTFVVYGPATVRLGKPPLPNASYYVALVTNEGTWLSNFDGKSVNLLYDGTQFVDRK